LIPTDHIYVEKPDAIKARTFLTDGNYSWNSGIFIWKAKCILGEISRQMPDLKRALYRIAAACGTSEQEEMLKTTWQLLKSETIDYGILEHAKNLSVLLAEGLEWSDLGSWDSLFDILKPDLNGKVVVNSDHIPVETHNSLINLSQKKTNGYNWGGRSYHY
jgi:mannose-1-phosphate guanylyltransferase